MRPPEPPRDPGDCSRDAEAEAAVICLRNNGIYCPCMASLRRPGPGNTHARSDAGDVTSDESHPASDTQQQTWLGSRNCNQNSSRCCLPSREAP